MKKERVLKLLRGSLVWVFVAGSGLPHALADDAPARGGQHGEHGKGKSGKGHRKHGPGDDHHGHGAPGEANAAAAQGPGQAGIEHDEKARVQGLLQAARVAVERGQGAGKGRRKARKAKGGQEAELTPEQVEAARAERKEAARAVLEARIRQRLKTEDKVDQARDVLGQHAKRLARLARIRAVAEVKRDRKVIARVDKLLALEQERHEQRLQQLASVAGGAEPGAVTASTAGERHDHPAGQGGE